MFVYHVITRIFDTMRRYNVILYKQVKNAMALAYMFLQIYGHLCRSTILQAFIVEVLHSHFIWPQKGHDCTGMRICGIIVVVSSVVVGCR